MARAGDDRVDLVGLRADLPSGIARTVDAFERYLRLERNRSAHTVRAYVGDVVSLLDHLRRLGGAAVSDLELQVLRSWLAKQRTTGAARSTLARRAASARTFTAWAHTAGYLATDPGELLASPRPHRALPAVLAADEAGALMDSGPADPTPIDRRDRMIVEILYATGIRVGELVRLDIDDLDRGRRVVRVFGKGSKERMVPYGLAMERALDDWLRNGRSALATASSGPPCCLAPGADALISAPCGVLFTNEFVKCLARRILVRTALGIPLPPTCSTAGQICARCRSYSATRASPPHRSTRTSPSNDCCRRTPKPIRVPERPSRGALASLAADVLSWSEHSAGSEMFCMARPVSPRASRIARQVPPGNRLTVDQASAVSVRSGSPGRPRHAP